MSSQAPTQRATNHPTGRSESRRRGISCNACLMASFSDDEGIQRVQTRLFEIHPGILKSLEIEKITLFRKVREGYRHELHPKVRQSGG